MQRPPISSPRWSSGRWRGGGHANAWNSLMKIWANQAHTLRRVVAGSRLLAEISLARVGLVLSFDASRLARNNRDWSQLLEVCSIFGTLIADGERLYDPRLYHDR